MQYKIVCITFKENKKYEKEATTCTSPSAQILISKTIDLYVIYFHLVKKYYPNYQKATLANCNTDHSILND